MKKTKIVCTIGPASEDRKVLTHLIASGMNVARLNFSHGDHEEHKKRIDTIKDIREKLKEPIAIILDTKGPEIRTGDFTEGAVTLKEGADFVLRPGEEPGDETGCSITYDNLADEVKPGDEILIDDGLVMLRVVKISGRDVVTRVGNGGTVKNRKGINIPGVEISLPILTEKDRSDLLFGIKEEVDFIAASFIRNKEDVFEIRAFLDKNGGENIHIISKIENSRGVENIDEIISASDGIMVARGDLGVEIPPQDVPSVQKDIIKKCNYIGKPVITATQMLDSMIANPRATRAEVTDVYNAIFDGTDAVMLSGETAAGKYPIEAVQTMGMIAEAAEKRLKKNFRSKREYVNESSMTSAVALSAVKLVNSLGAKAVLAPTGSGYTAKRISKFRPPCDIIAFTDREYVRRRLSVVWGVESYLMRIYSNPEDMFRTVIRKAVKYDYLQTGDVVVITAGIPLGVRGTTNTLRVETVGDYVLKGAGLNSRRTSGILRKYEGSPIDFRPGEILAVKGQVDETVVRLAGIAGGFACEEKEISNELEMVLEKRQIPVITGVDSFCEYEDGEEVVIDAARGILYRKK